MVMSLSDIKYFYEILKGYQGFGGLRSNTLLGRNLEDVKKAIDIYERNCGIDNEDSSAVPHVFLLQLTRGKDNEKHDLSTFSAKKRRREEDEKVFHLTY